MGCGGARYGGSEEAGEDVVGESSRRGVAWWMSACKVKNGNLSALLFLSDSYLSGEPSNWIHLAGKMIILIIR